MLFLIPCPTLYNPCSALNKPLPPNIFPIKLDPIVPNRIGKIGKAPPFYIIFKLFCYSFQ